jgi:hypothetical protein
MTILEGPGLYMNLNEQLLLASQGGELQTCIKTNVVSGSPTDQ